jgi:hypothetical protein
MNKRRLSFGLLVTLAAAAFAVGCDSTPPADAPPQPTAAPADTAAAATQTAAAEPPPAPTQTAAPEPPPPPPKPAKEKWAGKFVQDFSGDVQATADAAAKKAAGKNDKDNKKYNATMDKFKAGIAENVLENTDKTFTWNVKGKAAHTATIEITKGDDPATLTFKIVKDGKKDLAKKPIEVSITFKDDNTFEMKDPWAKDPSKAPTLVFKRQ